MITDFEPTKLARSTDPTTSHEAANRAGGLRAKHHEQILSALRKLRYSTLTPYEIAANAGLEPAAVFRRINELEKSGLIVTTGERVGPTGRKCRVWRAI